MRTVSYTDYQKRVCSLMGIPFSGLTSDELDFLKHYFTNHIKTVWNKGNWIDVSPYGEARFAGNQLSYGNNHANAAWTSNAVTTTANQLANPADQRTTASKLLETATTAAHSVTQSVTILPSIKYQLSVYARPIGRNHLYLALNDGTTTFYSFFNILTGVVGTNSGLDETPTCVQQANGFWLCTIKLTTGASATSGTVYHSLSTNGSTLSYLGDTSYGMYVWGSLLQQSSFANPASYLIPWAQTGESTIDVVFEVWRDNPYGPGYPRKQGYDLSVSGVQLVSTSGGYGYGYVTPSETFPTQPVYLYYRKQCPEFYGADYSASATYAVGDVILFTNSSSVANYYKCLVATSAGESPTTTAASWELQEIPEVFFQPVCFMAFADWLRQDGQFDKAELAERRGEENLNNEFDRLERQQAWVQPMKVATHVTSQPRQ